VDHAIIPRWAFKLIPLIVLVLDYFGWRIWLKPSLLRRYNQLLFSG